MTDITALMATMKAAASEITKDTWQLNADEEVVHIDSEGYENFIACTAITDLAQFIALASPSNIRALVEALEKAQRANASQDDHINQQADRIDTLERRNAELGKYAGELESRTVTVKLPKLHVSEVMLVSGYSRDYAEGWCAGNDNARHEIRAAGIQVIEGDA